jgi:hypothetical protein
VLPILVLVLVAALVLVVATSAAPLGGSTCGGIVIHRGDWQSALPHGGIVIHLATAVAQCEANAGRTAWHSVFPKP